jgi:hypothetical protein
MRKGDIVGKITNCSYKQSRRDNRYIWPERAKSAEVSQILNARDQPLDLERELVGMGI